MLVFRWAENWHATRFYYADAAAQQVILTAAAEEGLQDFDAGVGNTLSAVNFGLVAALTAYIGMKAEDAARKCGVSIDA